MSTITTAESNTDLLKFYISAKGGCAQHSDVTLKLFTCAACKFTQYCNRECQKSDWPRHRNVCKLLTEYKPPAQPEKLPKQISSVLVELQQECIRVVVETIRGIARDSYFRSYHYRQTPSLLKEGIFYGQGYFTARNRMKQSETLEKFIAEGHFYHGYASPDLFEMVKSRDVVTGFKRLAFVVKKGVLPSDALNGIRKGLSLLDGGTSCQIAYWEAIRHVLGERFDILFAADTSTPLRIETANVQDNPIFRLLTPVDTSSSKIKKGQMICFENVPSYLTKHRLFGIADNCITICCDDSDNSPLFTTLGLKFEGEKQDEICGNLFHQFNQYPFGIRTTFRKEEEHVEVNIKMPLVSPEMAVSIVGELGEENLNETIEMAYAEYHSIEDFKKDDGGRVNKYGCELNMKSILDLITAKTDKGARARLDWFELNSYLPTIFQKSISDFSDARNRCLESYKHFDS